MCTYDCQMLETEKVLEGELRPGLVFLKRTFVTTAPVVITTDMHI